MGDAEAIKEADSLRRKGADLLMKLEDAEASIKAAEIELQLAQAEDIAANRIAREAEAVELCKHRIELARQLDLAFAALTPLAQEYEDTRRELSRYAEVTGVTPNVIGNSLKICAALWNFSPAVAKILDVPRAPGGVLLTTDKWRKTLEEFERQSFGRFLAASE